MPRGNGTRCHGFLSEDGRYAHCSRDECGGGLAQDSAGTYAHFLGGPCRCGEAHVAAPAVEVPVPAPTCDRVLRDADFEQCPSPYPADYCDSSGKVLYRVARWQRRDGTKTYSFHHPDANGGWRSGRGNAQRVLYGLPTVREGIAKGVDIHVVEGEKKVRLFLERRCYATCNDGGAGKFARGHAEALRDARRVVVWGDNDEPGIRHVARICALLRDAGIPEVLVPIIPGLGEGEGVDDWLARQEWEPSIEAMQALVDSAPRWRPESQPVPERAAESPRWNGRAPWASIRTAQDFLNEVELEGDFLVPRILARGSVTLWFSPRGLGKTHVAHDLAVRSARDGRRVLLIDRDNSRRELRRRLAGWGAHGLTTLKVMDRDEAPPLTDHIAWAQFPFDDFDAVIVDAFDSSAEGVGEQDSSKSSLAVAVLLDIAHRASGPAVLVLGNTIKSGSHGRGSGVLEDRADIVYEVRDATDLRPSGTKHWWQELHPADRGSWADRAARRRRRDSYRLAFVPSKYRVGEEPEPFVLEVRLTLAPWTCEDVTSLVLDAGEETRVSAAREEVAKEEAAVSALSAKVAELAADGTPMRERDHVLPFLSRLGFTRRAAKSLIVRWMNKRWLVDGGGRKGTPKVLLPLDQSGTTSAPAGFPDLTEPRQLRLEESPNPAAEQPCGWPESASGEPAAGAGANAAGFPPPSSSAVPTQAASGAAGQDPTPPCPRCGGPCIQWSREPVCTRCHHKFGAPEGGSR